MLPFSLFVLLSRNGQIGYELMRLAQQVTVESFRKEVFKFCSKTT